MVKFWEGCINEALNELVSEWLETLNVCMVVSELKSKYKDILYCCKGHLLTFKPTQSHKFLEGLRTSRGSAMIRLPSQLLYLYLLDEECTQINGLLFEKQLPEVQACSFARLQQPARVDQLLQLRMNRALLNRKPAENIFAGQPLPSMLPEAELVPIWECVYKSVLGWFVGVYSGAKQFNELANGMPPILGVTDIGYKNLKMPLNSIPFCIRDAETGTLVVYVTA
ncbi:hypothetical protein AKJ16_DCAP07365 [Drosera capensis]